jgi:hypothetical protein
MFSSKVCQCTLYAIFVIIFICQTFYQPAEGNNEFAKIVNTFIGKMKKLIAQHSQQQGAHVANNVVEVQQTLLQISFSDCAKLHLFSLEYKKFLKSAANHDAKAENEIKECDYYINMFEVGFGKSEILGIDLP